MRIGYARASTADQNPDLREDALRNLSDPWNCKTQVTVTRFSVPLIPNTRNAQLGA